MCVCVCMRICVCVCVRASMCVPALLGLTGPALDARAAQVGRGLLEVHGAHVQLAAVGLREGLAAHLARVRLLARVTLYRYCALIRSGK